MTPATMIPDRSLSQRMEALQHANEVRSARAKLKRDLKARRVQIFDVLEAPPECVDTMKVLDLVLAAPKYGRVKATKALRSCQISPSKTVGGLSSRQRSELMTWIGR